MAYTGHHAEIETGLIDMGARLYDPLLKRVLSPEPIVSNVYNPLNHDPYAYVLNDPLTYVDPYGLQPCDELSGDSPDDDTI